MWALIVDGSINRIFKVPTAFKHPTTGIQYPRNWLTLASDSEKASVGFIEVTYSGSYKSSEYYNNIESAPVYDASKGTVVITKSSTAKNLANLKTSKKQSASDNAYGILQSTDWYVVRKEEIGTAIPSNVTAYRTAVRLVCNSLKTAIDSASDVDAVAALYTNSAGASSDAKTINPSSAVNTSSNTITSNGHGFIDDEIVYYDVGLTGTDQNTAIGGLVNNSSYYVFGKTTNTFKLSESHSSCGDAALVSLSSGATGTNHTVVSQGIPGKGVTWPNPDMPKYDGA